ncbi:MAG: DUF4384 domain-containing protein [Pseudomonadota bacterium]
MARIRPRFSLLMGSLALALTMILGVQSHAQERANEVPVARSVGDALVAHLKLYNAADQSWARIAFDNPSLAIGDFVSVCAEAKRNGYLSVWSKTLDGQPPVRIFPNDFTPEDRKRKGGHIEAGQEICLGDAVQGYGFEVMEPLGPAEVYLHWSPDLSGQFGPEDIPLIPDHGQASGARASSAPYSAQVIRYRTIAQ